MTRVGAEDDKCVSGMTPKNKVHFGGLSELYLFSSVARAASVLSSSTYSVQPCTGLPPARRCSRPGPW